MSGVIISVVYQNLGVTGLGPGEEKGYSFSVQVFKVIHTLYKYMMLRITTKSKCWTRKPRKPKTQTLCKETNLYSTYFRLCVMYYTTAFIRDYFIPQFP